MSDQGDYTGGNNGGQLEAAARRLMELFAGFDGAHGTHGVPDREGLKWGIKRIALTLREPVTLDLLLQHLSGDRPLGIVPIGADGSCCFGCIDVDAVERRR